MDDCTAPYRIDRIGKYGGILVCVREDLKQNRQKLF